MQSLYRYTVNYRRSVIPWNSARCFYRLVVQCILCCFYSYPSQYCNNVTKYWTRKGQILESSRNKTQNMIAWGQNRSLKNCIINEVVFILIPAIQLQVFNACRLGWCGNFLFSLIAVGRCSISFSLFECGDQISNSCL